MYTRLASVSLGKPCPTKVSPDRASSSSLKPLWDRIIFGLEMPLPRSTAQKLFSRSRAMTGSSMTAPDSSARAYCPASQARLTLSSSVLTLAAESFLARARYWAGQSIGSGSPGDAQALIEAVAGWAAPPWYCGESRWTKSKALADAARLISSLLEPRKGPCLSQVGRHSITGLPELGRLELCWAEKSKNPQASTSTKDGARRTVGRPLAWQCAGQPTPHHLVWEPWKIKPNNLDSIHTTR